MVLKNTCSSSVLLRSDSLPGVVVFTLGDAKGAFFPWLFGWNQNVYGKARKVEEGRRRVRKAGDTIHRWRAFSDRTSHRVLRGARDFGERREELRHSEKRTSTRGSYIDPVFLVGIKKVYIRH